MGLRKYAALDIIDSWIEPVGRRHRRQMRRAHRHQFSYQQKPDFLYVRSRAISSRCNDNYDDFPAPEIKKGYRTFVRKPVFVNHSNHKLSRARGVIVDAALHEDLNPDGSPDTWVEVLMEIDARKYPKLAKACIEGHIDRTSMGVDLDYSVCSICDNVAYTEADYCEHIPHHKGRIFQVGGQSKLCYESCYGLRFFENSLLVEPPGDPTAFVLGVEGNLSATAAGRRTSAYIDLKTTDAIEAKDRARQVSLDHPGQYVYLVNDFGAFAIVQDRLETQAPSSAALKGYWLNGTYKPFSERQVIRDQQATPALSSRRGGFKVAAAEPAPVRIDTLRMGECPVCGDDENYDGEQCRACGFVKPPDAFMDPRTDQVGNPDADGGAKKPTLPKPPLEGAPGDENTEDDTEAAPEAGGGSGFAVHGPGEEPEITSGDAGGTGKGFKVGALQHKTAGATCSECGQRIDHRRDGWVHEDGRVECDAYSESKETLQAWLDSLKEDFPTKLQQGPDYDRTFVRLWRDARDAINGQQSLDSARHWLQTLSDYVSDKYTTSALSPEGLRLRRGERNPVKGTSNTMRPALRMIAVTQARLQGEQEITTLLAKRLGMEREVAAIRSRTARKVAGLQRRAEEDGADNPAQPVPSPASETPAATTDQTISEMPKADLETPGAVNDDVGADKVTDVASVGEEIPASTGTDQNVEAPVSGVTDPRTDISDVRTEVDVQTGTADQSPAFPLVEDFAQVPSATSNLRQISATRLARLRIQAGIASGDDLTLAEAIVQDRRVTEAAIEAEISTLSQVLQARPAAPARTASRQPARAMPSLAGGGLGGGMSTTAASEAVDEYIFDGLS